MGDQDPGFLVGYALGNPHDGQLEIHVVVSIPMIRNEGLGSVALADGTRSMQTWDEWIAQHFRVTDESGRTVILRRAGFSSLITDQQANNPEFYLEGKVRAGATYIFDYIPFFRQHPLFPAHLHRPRRRPAVQARPLQDDLRRLAGTTHDGEAPWQTSTASWNAPG